MKIIYVTTISNTINAFLIPHIEMLLDQGHQVDIACNIVREIDSNLLKRGCKVFDLKFQRTPFSSSNYIAYKKMASILKENEYDIVHVHTPVAAAYTRLAAIKNKKVKVIYTAHGFHFFRGAPIKSWIAYYPIEYALSKYTDVLVTINQEDNRRANNKLKAKKVVYIPGVGMNSEKFEKPIVDIQEKKMSLGLSIKSTILLSVGELNRNKNHEIVIRALAQLKNKNLQYIICGRGNLETYLRELVYELKLENQVKFLGFRSDIDEIYQLSDLFIFPSLREGLPVSIMEAMASKLPIICSDIRGNSDLVINDKGGYLVKPTDINHYIDSISHLINDKKKMREFGIFNERKIKEFSLKSVLSNLENIYFDLNKLN